MSTAFHKTVHPGHVLVGRRRAEVYITIDWDGYRLSFEGVEGPLPSGNNIGGSGQIVDLLDRVTLDYVWNPGTLMRLLAVWRRWHRNDRRAGTPAQEDWLRLHPKRYRTFTSARAGLAGAGLNPDPATGAWYGHQWHHEAVPADVLDFLANLPSVGAPTFWRAA